MTTTATSTRPATRSLWRAGMLAAVVAASINSFVWLAGHLSPATWAITQGGQTLDVVWFMPAVASLAGIAAATLGLWVLARFPGGVTVWTGLAVLVGIGSSVAPLTGADDGWTGALLAAMHLVVLVVALALVRPAAQSSA